MIFYSVVKDIVINSKKTNKIICRFKDGKFETDDPILIEKLKPHFKFKYNETRGARWRKGKTFEEMYGKKKAKEIKLKMSRNHYKTLKGVINNG